MTKTIRLDQILVYLRFVRTRARAKTLIERGALRLNRKHVRRVAESVAIGDVMTVPIGNEVRVIEVLSLPDRRGSPEVAKSHYRELDRTG